MVKPADFMVILRPDLDVKVAAVLDEYPVTHTFPLPSGVVAKLLWCSAVEVGGPYLTVQAKHEGSEVFVQLHIPHWAVLTIAGSKAIPPIGFLQAGSTPPQD